MQDSDYILLLSKRFSGELTEAEANLLMKWEAQSEVNAQLAAQYQQVWEASRPKDKAFDLDLAAEFQQLRTRIKAEGRLPARRNFLLQPLLRVAAAALFLLGAFWGYRQLTGGVQEAMVEITASNEIRTVDLPDGTRVWLREDARLLHPSAFTGSSREVRLFGEAYFDVTRDEDRPFRVALEDGGLIDVLGTKFLVAAAKKAASTTVLVREGKVRFSPDSNHPGTVLGAGDKAVFKREQRRLQMSTVTTFNELAWQQGGLEFISTPLRQVITDLKEYYQVDIQMPDAALQNCRYTAPLTNQPIETVLKTLALTFRMKVSRNVSGTYILSGGVCR